MPVDVTSIVLRALSFVALFQAAGAAIFVALFSEEADASRAIVRRIGSVAATAGIALAAGHYALEAARMAGEFAGVFDASLQQLVLASSSSTAVAWRIAGLALIASGLHARSALGQTATLVGATLVTTAFALAGHTAESPFRWGLSLALIAHLLAIAFWFGGLVPLYLMSRREALPRAAEILDRYSSIATRVVPGLFIAGVLLTMFLMSSLANLTSPYGLLILGKVALFAVLMALATLNKWRFGPAMARGDATAATSFQRSVLAELALIVIILAMTATLTSLYSPCDPSC